VFGCCCCTQETELRTLKAAAEEVAGKFDAAVAALAAKRLDVLAEVRAAAVGQRVRLEAFMRSDSVHHTVKVA
jgi:hypothetical protein